MSQRSRSKYGWFCAFSLVVALGFLPCSGHSEEEHKGAFSSITVGPSVLTLQKGSIYFSKFAGHLLGESGYRFNESFGLGFAVSMDLGTVDGGFFVMSDFMLSPSIYLLEDLEIMPSAGLALLGSERFIDDVFINSGVKLGMAAGLRARYNFKVGNGFKMGPTARFAFNRASGANIWAYGLSLTMTFAK
ncbi:MAG: hypothetical protein KDD48_01700 [Bdellovibrionales bacterium]|nr:hypothetical protein [Bdellovibrionales bacterium]